MEKVNYAEEMKKLTERLKKTKEMTEILEEKGVT